MIKFFKNGELVYQNIVKPYWFEDGDGNAIAKIPNDLNELRTKTIDTLSWLIGQSVKSATGGHDFTKLSAANSKGIVLIAKLIDSLNPDTSVLSENERSAFEKMLQLAGSGYADSELLNRSLESVMASIQKYSALIEQATQAQSVDELVAILESL